MALHNPAGLYQSQASLNPLPYVNIALQARARKQAREQAIDQYYQKLPDTINDKGVRDQEIPIINEYKNKIFEYGYKNKEALRKGDGAAQLGLQQLMREAQSVARESQDLGRRGLERGKMYLSKEGRWAVDDDEFMAAEEAESQPLYVVKDGQIIKNPTHNKMDMVGLLSNRPFDEKEFGKEIKDKVKYGTKIQTTNDPTNPLFDIVSEVPSLDESSKGKIYAFAAEKLHGNRRFEDFIKKKTPEQLAILGEVYKETFGKPAEDDEDFAAGYVISQLPIQSTKQKRPQDTDAVMDKRRKEGKEDWLWKNGITYQQSLNKIRANKESGVALDAGVPYPTEEVANKYGEDVETTDTKTGVKSTQRVIFTDKADPNEIDFIRGFVRDKSLGVQPYDIEITENGKPTGRFRKGFYYNPGTKDWEGKGGQKVNADMARRRLIDDVVNTKIKIEQNAKDKSKTKETKPKGKYD